MLRVLLIDDSAVAAEMIAWLLRRTGAEVEVAGTAAEGVAAFRRRPADMVVVDLVLPDGDGREVVARLAGRAVFVALTGFADADTEASCLEAGFDHFLTKPVNIEDLLAVLPVAARP